VGSRKGSMPGARKPGVWYGIIRAGGRTVSTFPSSPGRNE
jgi:hypothetical protein